MSMFGTIILRDIPKEEARIDLARFSIQGGFRGFSSIPPSCWHYVTVKAGAEGVELWCWLQAGEVIVKRFTPEGQFTDEEPDTAEKYRQLAQSGAMDSTLLAYPHNLFGAWYGLISHISRENFPPTLHHSESHRTRFEEAFLGLHQGQVKSFLSEFQYAFVRWLISLDKTKTDQAALERWQHLLLSAYNAGTETIKQADDLFPKLVDVLIRQFALLPDKEFTPEGWLMAQVDYMIEDMIDAEAPALVEKGKALKNYLKMRQETATNTRTN